MKFSILQDNVKIRSRYLLKPVFRVLIKLDVSPNYFTTAALLFGLVSAVLFGRGDLRLGALLLALGGLFDIVDGTVARETNRVTKFGAFYDSVLDRYSEIFVLFGIGYYYIRFYNPTSFMGTVAILAVFFALAGSIMVSYVRARAEGLGLSCNVGVMQRPERVAVIVLTALVSEMVLVMGLILIAIMANFTAFQRIYHVYITENARQVDKINDLEK